MIKLITLPLFRTPAAPRGTQEYIRDRKRLAEQEKAIEALDQALNMRYTTIDRFEHCDCRYFVLYRPATGGAYA